MFHRSIEDWADVNPDEPAVYDAQGVHRWSHLRTRIDALCDQFPSGGCSVLLLNESVDGVALLAASSRTSHDAIVVSGQRGEQRARELLRHGIADRIISTDTDRLNVVPNTDDSGASGRAIPSSSLERRSATGSVSLLTSGSTGRPKCSRHTWSSLCASIRVRERHRGCRWFSGYPIARFAGLQVTLQALLNGGSVVLTSDSSPRAGLHMLIKRRVDHLNCTPTFFRRLLMTAAPNDWRELALQTITLGGERTDGRLLDAISKAAPRVRVRHVYASSELGVLMYADDGREGFPVSFVDGDRLKIQDGQLYGRRSAQSMSGYLDRDTHWLDDWFPTRDLVEIRDDRVIFLGRVDDVINVGGAKVSPAAVENVLRDIPGVIDVRVVGQHSSIVGQLVKAVLWVARDVDPQKIQAQARAACESRLERHMVPRLFEFTHDPILNEGQKLTGRSAGTPGESR